MEKNIENIKKIWDMSAKLTKLEDEWIRGVIEVGKELGEIDLTEFCLSTVENMKENIKTFGVKRYEDEKTTVNEVIEQLKNDMKEFLEWISKE